MPQAQLPSLLVANSGGGAENLAAGKALRFRQGRAVFKRTPTCMLLYVVTSGAPPLKFEVPVPTVPMIAY